jgi:uncharacterized membrane protein YvbJ
MVQYCGQCGAEIPDDPSFKFCEKCGCPVVKTTLTKLSSAAPEKKALSSSVVPATKEPFKNRLYLIIGSGFLLLFFLH